MKNIIKEIILLVTSVVVLVVFYGFLKNYLPNQKSEQNIPPLQTVELKNIKTFESEKDFKDYLEKSKQLSSIFGRDVMFASDRGVAVLEAPERGVVTFEEPGEGASPSRYSETNVQVFGIDEPDIVKTNGKEIFVSQKGGIIMPFRYPGPDFEQNFVTKIVQAFPPRDMKLVSKIDDNGDLLLYDNVLVVISFDKISAFDVSNAEKPSKLWEIKTQDSSRIQTGRLYGGNLYIVSSSGIDYKNPCPIRPFLEMDIIIPCERIYHPIEIIPSDIVFNIFKIDTRTGKIVASSSFVGDSNNTVVYMSKDNMYIANFIPDYSFDPTIDFIELVFKGIIPDEILDKIKKIKEYDISTISKFTELSVILEKYIMSLSKDESLKFENELENRIEDNKDKIKSIARESIRTSITKLNNEDLSLTAESRVPGTLISQFSMDEYQGNLRVATTIRRSSHFFLGEIESFNDLYVLDKNLNIIGKVLDFGQNERIYGVRFIEDKGYIVTFREVDPFFVIDLSDSQHPEIKGELKIPGYSSYLHPITKDLIIGIGKEGSNVKISLFDVSDPSNPKEVSRYSLKEFWSDILSTHHAFLLDKKHELFFVPGSKGGYIFSYKNNDIELKKAVSERNVLRALYIDDYLYLVSNQKIVVIDENTFERVGETEI